MIPSFEPAPSCTFNDVCPITALTNSLYVSDGTCSMSISFVGEGDVQEGGASTRIRIPPSSPWADPVSIPGHKNPTVARAWRIIDPVEEEFSVWVSKDWRNSLGRTAERTKPTNPGHQGCESLSTLGNKGIRSFGREDQDHGRAAEDDPHHPVRTNGDT